MPLQKSFSEQNHSSKQPRPTWQRNRSYVDTKSRNELKGLKHGSEGPRIPLSSATQNKLNVFQFGAQPKDPQIGKTTSPHAPCVFSMADKGDTQREKLFKTGNTVILDNDLSTGKCLAAEKIPQNLDQDMTNRLMQSPKNQSASVRWDVPTTPAGKLALPDLIGMVDIQTLEHEISPDERIMWRHDADITHNASSSYGALKRVKKRARSSSPTSSSPVHTHAYASAHFNSKGEVFDLERLSQSLKTPQVDHGPELGGRYGVDSEDATPHGLKLPALAHIMYTSSPQSSRQGVSTGNETNLRRAIGRSNSCGTEWPKRRRIVVMEDQPAEDMFTESFNTGLTKLSMVSVLLGKVQDGFTSSATAHQSPEPSSSSPVPNLRPFVKREDSSPLRNRNEKAVATKAEVKLPNSSLHTENFESAPKPEAKLGSSSSDYGDFDDEEFDEGMCGVMATKSNSSSMIALPVSVVQLESRISGELLSCETFHLTKASKAISTIKENDEFGDVDDELLAVDLENIVSKYDTRLPIGDKAAFSVAEEMAKADIASGMLNQKRHVEVESDDEFGNDFSDVDFDAVEAAATQSLQHLASSPPTPSQKVRSIQRYLITNVVDCQYETANGRSRPEKVLLVRAEQSKTIKSVHLRDGWFETRATPKAYVHIIGDFKNGRCVIDDVHNMVILHPDHLISSTVVADSFNCTRRAVLQERVKATSAPGPPLIYGTILHEIFQASMIANRWDSEWLNDLITTTVTRHLEDLYTTQLQIPQAIEYLKSKMGELQSWAEVFVSSQPKVFSTCFTTINSIDAKRYQPEAIVKTGNGESATMCVSKLLDVEEHVWSPMYGLKGNIDATVQVTMKDGEKSRTLTVPLEVKTGKNANASHRAQTALYNLLLSDRYDVEVAYGILYYMETSETIRIPGIRHEVRHMIMQRNELACFVRERISQLPPMLKQERPCRNCYAQVPCFIYHRLADDGNGETSGMKARFDDVVRHLTPRHKEFFLKWDDLLTKEEKESLKFRRELWTMLSSEREKLGRCFSNVIVEPGSAYEDNSSPKINRFRYILIKESPISNFSFLDSQIMVGEPIVISDEKGNFALANGYVTHVRKGRITVAVDRRLHNARIRCSDFDETNNQVFTGIMEVPGEASTADQTKTTSDEPLVRYRLDKDEFSNGMALVRNNLIQVMAEGPFGSREIRSLVVDLAAPQYKPHSTAYTLIDRVNINVDQRRAIEKVMSAQDYALVLGMPGTGKTTTIAHIIRALVSQRKSVLLTSYTHTAVDNILLKLKKDNIPILRLGAVAKIHPEVQEFATLAVQPKETFEEIKNSWHDSPIVATTCLGINHPIFNERTFDYCIVDEASQITLPVCLGPIRMARTFVLVGDHNQLPPLVQNEEARTGGLDVSLFKHLSDMHPSSVVNLEHQYRMCEQVMSLSNDLIYSGRLKCGTPEVAARSITIPNMGALEQHHFSSSTLSKSQKMICTSFMRGRCWLRDLLEPTTKVAFVNTDPLLPISREDAKGNRIVNYTEVKICTQLVESLIRVGVPASSIGVMTHYRSQLALLKHSLRSHNDVEMHTADRFQGRDKEVVILSLVRSNEAKTIGDLLKDWRRINVAFTRAKTKLLVVGSRETLKGNASEEMVSKFVNLMEEKGWVYDLPKDALDSHLFDEGATQATASGKSQPALTQRVVPDGGEKKDPLACKKHERFPVLADGKENKRLEPKRMRVGERALLAGKPVLRDIVNDLIGA